MILTPRTWFISRFAIVSLKLSNNRITMNRYTGFAKTSLVRDSDSSKRFSSRVTLVSPKRVTMHNEMSKAAFYYKLKVLNAQ